MTPFLPPRALWPDKRYLLPELQYARDLDLVKTLVDAQVDAGRGGATALVGGGQRVTYGELQAWAARLGHVLQSSGVLAGDRVVLRFGNGPQLVALWLAIQKIGGVAVATAPALRGRELAYILNDTEARACVFQADLVAAVEHAWPSLIAKPALLVAGTPRDSTLTAQSIDDGLAQASLNLASQRASRDRLAVIAYTFGIDVDPKGACYFASDLLVGADTYARHVLRLTPGDVVGGSLSLAFAFGLCALLALPLRIGACSVLLDGFRAETLLHAIEEYRITVLFGTATSYRLLLRIPGFERQVDLRSLRLCVSAGEPLDVETSVAWTRRTGVELIDSFGTTEMCHVFLSQRPGAIVLGSLGSAVPGYTIRVVDDALRDVPRGSPGLLAVQGPTGCVYWRRDAAQRLYVRGGWNVTGDVVVQDMAGFVWFRGRRDELIISAGSNISPAEVEGVLRAHSAVEDAAVVAAPDPIRGAVPKAWVVVRSDVQQREGLIPAIQEYLQGELAGYKCPRRFEFVDSIPRTPGGAVDRDALGATAREAV